MIDRRQILQLLGAIPLLDGPALNLFAEDAKFHIGAEAFLLPNWLTSHNQTAKEQQQSFHNWLKDEYEWEDFSRDSIVAPHSLRITDGTQSKENPVSQISLVFILYPHESWKQDPLSFKKPEDFSESDTTKLIVLSNEDLKSRKIGPANENSSWGHLQLLLLDRIQLQLTGNATLAKDASSWQSRFEMSHIFDGDKQFPNNWQHPNTTEDNSTPAKFFMYPGAGGCFKISQFKPIEGAYLAEMYLIFSEPKEWFNGVNLLRSKLPPILQVLVRRLRKEVKKPAK